MLKKIPFYSFILSVLTELQLLVYRFPVKEFDGATNQGLINGLLKPALIVAPAVFVMYRALYIRKGRKNNGAILQETSIRTEFTSPAFMFLWGAVYTIILGLLVGLSIVGSDFTVSKDDISVQIALFWLGVPVIILGLIVSLGVTYSEKGKGELLKQLAIITCSILGAILIVGGLTN